MNFVTCREKALPDQSGKAPHARLVTLGLTGLCTGLAMIFIYIGQVQRLKDHVPELIALLLLAGVLYLVGVHLVETYRLGVTALILILAGSVLFRAVLLPVDPAISGDVYRYQWDGRVQRARMNPYEVFPAMPELAMLQDPQHPLTEGGTTPTIYPPLSEIVFRAVKTTQGYKELFTFLDLGSIVVILALLASYRKSLHRVLVYAWNPGVVISFSLSGHHDSLAIFSLICAFLFLARSRPKLSLISLALSILAKLFPLPFLPIFLRKARIASVWIFMTTLLLFYLPYLGAGTHLFTGLTNFSKDWEGNDSAFRLIRLIIPIKQHAEWLAIGIVLLLLAYVMIGQKSPLEAGLILTGGILLVSPNAFPWYFTWLVPYLCFFPKPSWLVMSLTSVLGYAPVVSFAAGQPWRDSPFLLTVEYLPAYALIAYEFWKGRRFGVKNQEQLSYEPKFN